MALARCRYPTDTHVLGRMVLHTLTENLFFNQIQGQKFSTYLRTEIHYVEILSALRTLSWRRKSKHTHYRISACGNTYFKIHFLIN